MSTARGSARGGRGAAEELLRPFSPPRPSLAILDPARDAARPRAEGAGLVAGARRLHGPARRARPSRWPRCARSPTGNARPSQGGAGRGRLDRGPRPSAGAPAASVEQLLKRVALAEVGGDRGFVARTGSARRDLPALFAGRDRHGRGVATLEPARNRGFARAVVLAAARPSRGWQRAHVPRSRGGRLAAELYARLGFESVGREHIYEKRPPKRGWISRLIRVRLRMTESRNGSTSARRRLYSLRPAGVMERSRRERRSGCSQHPLI